MQHGAILKWLAAHDAEVARGDEQTEVVTSTCEADAEGLAHHVAREGDTPPVGATIAFLAVGKAAPTGSGDQPVTGQAAGLDGVNGEAGNPVPSLGGSSLAVLDVPTTRVTESPMTRRVADERGRPTRCGLADWARSAARAGRLGSIRPDSRASRTCACGHRISYRAEASELLAPIRALLWRRLAAFLFA